MSDVGEERHKKAARLGNDLRFELRDGESVVGRYQTKTEALHVAHPGDSLLDVLAAPRQIELWIVGGDMDFKVLRAIRRRID